jgi:uncharacterized small protein (DUF1192 family)
MAVMVAGSVIVNLFLIASALMPERSRRDKRSMPACCLLAAACERPPVVAELQHRHERRALRSRSWPMDWDDIKPKPTTGVMIGDNLSSLSVGELEARIEDLEKEIVRVRAELDAKRKHEDAASALFKR